MKSYEELVMRARKKTLKLTQRQQKEILKIYQQAIDSLAEKARSAKRNSLTERWAKDYLEQVEAEVEQLRKNLSGAIKGGVSKAAGHGVEPDIALFKATGIDLGDHFTEMFSKVPDDVLAVMLRGDLYKDGRGLSSRIWRISADTKQDIDYIIHRAMAEKKSAIELAKDLEQFVKPEHRRPGNWGRAYPNLRTKQVDYNAQRLARTSITHAHREAQYRSAAANPFVEAVHWELSDEHYNRQVKHWGEDICDDYANQNWHGLGKGNFPPNQVPIGHPQCLCHTYPVIEKSLDEIADELKAWVDGKNPELDERISGGKAKKRKADKGKMRLDKFVSKAKKVLDMDINDRVAIGKKILRELNLGHIPVRLESMSLNGYCRFDVSGDEKMQILEYVLDAGDIRGNSYRIKTAFHEAFHARADGRKTTVHMSRDAWVQIEETFAETAAHYMAKAIGIKDEIAPAYAEKLVDILPRLKQMPEYKNCNTFADFGKIAWEERLKGGNSEWTALHGQAMGKPHDWKEYSKQYLDYIDNNKDELLDVMLSGMPEYKDYKSNMAEDYLRAKIRILSGNGMYMNSNEEMVMSNLLAIAMNREGVK